MKAFLLTFDQSHTTRDVIVRSIDRIDAIENWYALFEGAIIVASRLTARQVSSMIREKFPDLKFILVEVDPQHKAGWLPRSVWTFLNDPHPAQPEPA
jgi:hypothetical protein